MTLKSGVVFNRGEVRLKSLTVCSGFLRFRFPPQGRIANYNNIGNLWKVDVTDLQLQVGKKIVKSNRGRVVFMMDTE